MRPLQWCWVLHLALLLYGPLHASSETITGRLSLFTSEGAGGPLTAVVVQPSPGDILTVVNWVEIQAQLETKIRSGAEVSVTGARTPDSSSTAFLATAMEVVTAAPPSTLSYQKGFVPKVAVRADLSILVLRPRLGGAKCAAPYRTSNSTEEEWVDLVSKLSKFQSACTGGKLSYLPPVVTPYFDIPCTMMPNKTEGCQGDCKCDETVWLRRANDAMRLAKTKHKLKLDLYDHVVIDLPLMENCGWAGRAEQGGKGFYVNGKFWFTGMAHEMGHNYGLGHAARYFSSPDEIPTVMPPENVEDDSNLMGYSTGDACMSFPHSAALGLMTGRVFGPARLPPGQVVSTLLRPNWDKSPQGIVFSNLGTQTSDWRVWGSYIVSTSSPYGDLLTNHLYNKAVVLHVTSDSWEWGGVPAVYRVRVLQSGETFRWSAMGLVFKFSGLSSNGQGAFLQACREADGITCSLDEPSGRRPRPSSLEGLWRLWLPAMSDQGQPNDWCLRACTRGPCALPTSEFPASADLRNVFFTSPCPTDSSAMWERLQHASGYTRYRNRATGRCLSIWTQSPFNLTEETVWYRLNYPLVLEPCTTRDFPDFREDPQLWWTRVEDSYAQLHTIESGLLYPGCPQWCGNAYRICAQACSYWGPDGRPVGGCTHNLAPSTNDTRHTRAMAGYCWTPEPYTEKLFRPLPV